MTAPIPSTCRAVIVTKYGQPADAIKIIDNHPVPTPKSNEILIKTAGSSVNPLDWKILLGNLAAMRAMKFPYVLGCDFSGTVVAVGKDCKTRKVGDRVYGLHDSFKQGVMADYMVKQEHTVNIAPKSVPLAEASSIPMVYITSYQALLRNSGVKAGDKVLIIGGSSGTGSAAVQVAKALGASTVAATCSSRNVEFVRSLGADVVIAYDKQQWETELEGQNYDVICDCIAMNEYYQVAHQVLKPRGIYVSLNFAGSAGVDPNAKFVYSSLFTIITVTAARKIRQLLGGISYHVLFADADSAQARVDLDAIAKLFDEGKCRVAIEKVYPVKDTAAMYAANMTGRTRGKLVATFE